MTTEQFANNATSTLNGTISSSVTALVVASVALFPTSPQFRIIIDSEIMLVTGIAGTTFTVTRGVENTTQASHTTGAAVSMILTSGALSQFKTDTLAAAPAITTISDAVGNLPAPSVSGRIFIPTDRTFSVYRDNGSSWLRDAPENFPTYLFTSPPPVASNWTQIYGVTGAVPTDIPGGVTFSRGASDGVGVWGKTLASPGGTHLVSMFVRQQTLLNQFVLSPTGVSGQTDVTNMCIILANATKYVMVGNLQVDTSNTTYRLIQQRFLVDNSLDTSIGSGGNINYLWPTDTTATPFGDAWWKISFNNTNATILRASPGGLYYSFASFTHGLGAISKVGFEVQAHLGVSSCTLLDYVET